MKITYQANPQEMTELANLLKARHRRQIRLQFSEAGVVAEVEVPAEPAAADSPLAEALSLAA